MKDSCIAFKLLKRHGKPHVTYTKITYYLVFDLQLDMTTKAQYMAEGNLKDVPTYMIYSSVMSCVAVHIGFLMYSLNGLDILARDIINYFLESPQKEIIFFYAGNECKSNEDIVVVEICVLCGLKSSAL